MKDFLKKRINNATKSFKPLIISLISNLNVMRLEQVMGAEGVFMKTILVIFCYQNVKDNSMMLESLSVYVDFIERMY